MRQFGVPCFVIVLLSSLALFNGCTKSSSDTTSTAATDTSVTYQVSACVKNSAGTVQGGATLALLNPPSSDSKYTTVTDSTGWGTIYSPKGSQTLVAKIGSVFYASLAITVTGSSSAQVVSTPLTLTQNTSLGSVLVVQGGCETLEEVLRKIGFTTFDSITVSNLRSKVQSDSSAALTYLKNYSIVFSDCDCGDEEYYPGVGRVYGRYISAGGKVYGGHYNYYNLQDIFVGYYLTQASPVQVGYYDTVLVANSGLKTAVRSVIPWPNQRLSNTYYYKSWTDIPSTGTATLYATLKNQSSTFPVIVENYSGTGKFVWTEYHNQDIIDDSTAIKIVYYFLYSM